MVTVIEKREEKGKKIYDKKKRRNKKYMKNRDEDRKYE